MAYFPNLGLFDLYSEDLELIGTKIIKMEAYLADYTTTKSDMHHVQASIEIIDPCLEPDSITAPAQQDPEEYFYTTGSTQVKVTPFVVVPSICPVTYECVEINGPDPDVKCGDSGSIPDFDSV